MRSKMSNEELVKEWLKTHKVRKFPMDLHITRKSVVEKMNEYGVTVKIHGNKFKIIENGKGKIIFWETLLKLFDEQRKARGLEPVRIN